MAYITVTITDRTNCDRLSGGVKITKDKKKSHKYWWGKNILEDGKL
jgi:hypothetical protein